MGGSASDAEGGGRLMTERGGNRVGVRTAKVCVVESGDRNVRLDDKF